MAVLGLAPADQGGRLPLGPAGLGGPERSAAFELQAGRPTKKGNKRGPAYAYNVKELRDREKAVAEQAERAYEQLVAGWRRPAGQEAHGRRKRGRAIVTGEPARLPAAAPLFATRSPVPWQRSTAGP